MTNTQPSTLATYSPKWVVKCDRQEFVLTDKEMQVIKQASAGGNRGLVWFKDFAISIAHIQSITKQKQPVTTWKEEYNGMATNPKGLEKIDLMKKAFEL